MSVRYRKRVVHGRPDRPRVAEPGCRDGVVVPVFGEGSWMRGAWCQSRLSTRAMSPITATTVPRMMIAASM